MTFSVSGFNAKISNHGLARNNAFIVSITPPLAMASDFDRDLRFFCKSVDLPSMNITTTDHNPQGFGMTERRPTGFSKSALPATFMMDSGFKVKRFFHRWIQETVNYDTSAGILSEVNGQLPYEIAYKNDYVGTMEISCFSQNNPDRYYTYILSDVHPIDVGEIGLSWESNDEIMTLPVSFSYTGLKVDGSRSGTVTGGVNRGAGLLSYLSSLNTYTQAIRSIDRPRS